MRHRCAGSSSGVASYTGVSGRGGGGRHARQPFFLKDSQEQALSTSWRPRRDESPAPSPCPAWQNLHLLWGAAQHLNFFYLIFHSIASFVLLDICFHMENSWEWKYPQPQRRGHRCVCNLLCHRRAPLGVPFSEKQQPPGNVLRQCSKDLLVFK